jgi:hypothetical protein
MIKPDSIIKWIEENKILTEKGKPLEFHNHPFLIDIYEDWSPKQVIKKCAQIGFSVTTIVKDIFLSYFNDYTIIYTLPTREMVFEHVPTKVDIIVDKNPILQQMVIGKESSTQKKRCGHGFILYKGTFGERESIMTSSDLNTYDECDRSNQDVIAGLESRLGASDYGGEWWFSNPTYPNVGVCKIYNESDQMKWHIKCPKCRKDFPADYHAIICYERSVYACPHCFAVIEDDDRRNGKWKPLNPGAEIRGYHISKTMCPWVPATYMIKAERDKKPDIFHNFDLGEGYVDGTKTITGDVIKACECPPNVGSGEYLAVGIDQGPSKFHCTVGPRHGISKIIVLETWEQVEDLISSPLVRSVVIDAQPERREASKLAKKYPYKVWNCFYVDDPRRPADLDPLTWSDSEGIVKAERTLSIDNTVHRFIQRDINIYLDNKYPLYTYSKRKGETYVEQWANLFVVESLDKHGNNVRRWENSGHDHWAHSTNYWNMAVDRLPRKIRKKKPNNYQAHDSHTGY